MSSILQRIELRNQNELVTAILERTTMQWYVVVSFLYFANLMKGRLLEGTPESWQEDYLHSLRESDFLLADGIALQLFYRWGAQGRQSQVTPPNLNGTDFNPYFFDQVLGRYEKVHIGLAMFRDERIGKWEDYAGKAVESFAERFGHTIDYLWQTNYVNKDAFAFPREEYEASMSEDDEIRIFFVCLGTPTQEVWIQKNMKQVDRLWLIVLNAGGTIDYITWLEQRAPDRVVRARVLETFWRISTQPKKNLKKFLAMFGVVRWFWSSLVSKVKWSKESKT